MYVCSKHVYIKKKTRNQEQKNYIKNNKKKNKYTYTYILEKIKNII